MFWKGKIEKNLKKVEGVFLSDTQPSRVARSIALSPPQSEEQSDGLTSLIKKELYKAQRK